MTLETQPPLCLHKGANSPSWTTGKHQVDFFLMSPRPVTCTGARWTVCFLCYEGILKWERKKALHKALGLCAGCSGSPARTSVPNCCPLLGSCKTGSVCGRDGKQCRRFLPPFLGQWWNPAKANFLWQLCPESKQEENQHLESRLVMVWRLFLKTKHWYYPLWQGCNSSGVNVLLHWRLLPLHCTLTWSQVWIWAPPLKVQFFVVTLAAMKVN